jgi:ParB/RepB/Spo0J family partition protein
MTMPRANELRDIPISQIDAGVAPGVGGEQDLRRDIEELLNSIRKFGLLQPVIVCEIPGGRYELIAGRRRVFAHVLLQVSHIAAVILDRRPDPEISAAVWATENLVRRTADYEEIRIAFAALLDRFGSAADVAEQTGIPIDKVQSFSKL